MKIILASLIVTLATYAQACSAQDMQMSIFSEQQTFDQFSQNTVQPTWLIGQTGKLQVMGFTQVTRTHRHLDNDHQDSTTRHHLGFGVHQQITSFFYTQMVITEHNGGQPTVKLGVEF
ncbi:hypothetical protein ACU6U9_00730 [Pseudomonas sp. HK3]|jgi:hypothetical protein